MNKLMSKILVLLIFFIPLVGFSQIKSETLFYMTDSYSSLESFKVNASQVSIVSPQVFTMTEEGVIYGSLNPVILKIARKNDVRVIPLIVNKGFDSGVIHSVISSEDKMKMAIDMMLVFAKRYQLDGWQFDIEGINLRDRDAFTTFYERTADSLHKYNLQLSAAVVHATDNTGGPSAYTDYLFEQWRDGYDFKKLATKGDFISIMSYSQHTRRTTPGPVAGVNWMENIVEYLLSIGVPAERLSLGIPSYSSLWFADYTMEKGGFSNSKSVKGPEINYYLEKFNAKMKWDSLAQVNYAVWDNGGVYEYLFVENGKSLKPKLKILEKYKLRGISVWVLGSEPPDFWEALKSRVSRSTIR